MLSEWEASPLSDQIRNLRLSRGQTGVETMAKENKRGNREAKKPKQAPKSAPAAAATVAKGLSPDIGKSKKN